MFGCVYQVEFYLHDVGSTLKFNKAFKNIEGDANYTKYFNGENPSDKKIDGPLDNEDWKKAEVLLRFLKQFCDISLRFSGSMYVTSNLFLSNIFKVQLDLNHVATSSTDLIERIAKSMKQKHDKY